MNDLLARLPDLLLPWYEVHKRELPWRQDREPYHVWLSEIMLQQTRVEAVKGYYARFLHALPTVQALAEAPMEQLNKLWEGLGYYSRVRNLQKAAQVICSDHGGSFPETYSDVLALPGIGAYTAGAVCSICFGLPTPAVDGNVLRVLSRLTADGSPIDKTAAKQAVSARLQAVYPAGRCGDFTQALMELGATVCVPNGAPRCPVCPLSALCMAHRSGAETDFPVRGEKKPRRTEDMTVFLLRCGDLWAMEKRPAAGLLAGLWEFPHVSGTLQAQAALEQAERWGVQPVQLEQSSDKRHIFTHVQWNMRGWYIRCRTMAPQFQWARPQELALPTAFRQFVPQLP